MEQAIVEVDGALSFEVNSSSPLINDNARLRVVCRLLAGNANAGTGREVCHLQEFVKQYSLQNSNFVLVAIWVCYVLKEMRAPNCNFGSLCNPYLGGGTNMNSYLKTTPGRAS